MQTVDKIMAFEQGELNNKETLELFSDLIKSGMCWSLQGCYGRIAKSLISNLLISGTGVINWARYQELSCK